MPNTFIALDVPRGDGTGTPAFVGLTGHPKTFVLAGSVAPGARYVVEGSNDGANWDILVDDDDGTQVLFTTGSSGAKTIDCVVQQVRVRAAAASGAAEPPSITMGAPPANGTPVFGTLDVPIGTGSGAPFDLGVSTGPLKTFILRGSIPSGSRYAILASMDGLRFDEILLFTSDQEGVRSRSVMCRFLQVQRNAAGQAPVITVGAEALFEPNGGGVVTAAAELAGASEREMGTVTETEEEVLAEYAVPLGGLDAPRLVLDFSGIGGALGAEVETSFRVRQGGSVGAPDGAEVAAFAITGSGKVGFIRSDPFDRPIDVATLVKVTGHGGPGARAGLRGFVLRYHPAGV
jgi:hypothetical protein